MTQTQKLLIRLEVNNWPKESQSIVGAEPLRFSMESECQHAAWLSSAKHEAQKLQQQTVSGKWDPGVSWKKRRTYLIPTRMTIIKRTDGNKCWWARGETGTPHTAGVKVNWGSHPAEVWQSLRKLNIESPYDPAIPFLEMNSREMKRNIHSHKKTCTQMFTASLFTIAKKEETT